MKPILLLVSGFLLSGIVFTGVSCQKDTDCRALVRCKDTLGKPVGEAYVELFALVKSADGKTTFTSDIKATGSTDGGGEVRFTFKLPAILDIKATANRGGKNITGIGIIKLEEGETVEKEVTLR
jgi:hypothetical protein